MYRKLSKIAEFLYGKSPEFHGEKGMKTLFYHLRIWLGVIGNTWFALCTITGYFGENGGFVNRLLGGLGIWLAIWLLLKMGTYGNN